MAVMVLPLFGLGVVVWVALAMLLITDKVALTATEGAGVTGAETLPGCPSAPSITVTVFGVVLGTGAGVVVGAIGNEMPFVLITLSTNFSSLWFEAC